MRRPFQAVEKASGFFRQPEIMSLFCAALRHENSRFAPRTPCKARLCATFDLIRGGLCPLELPPCVNNRLPRQSADWLAMTGFFRQPAAPFGTSEGGCLHYFRFFSFFSFSPTFFMIFRHTAELILSRAAPAKNSFFFIVTLLSRVCRTAASSCSVPHVILPVKVFSCSPPPTPTDCGFFHRLYQLLGLLSLWK